MKKIIMILLSAVCICVIVAGCGGKVKEGQVSESENSSASDILTAQESDTMHLNMLFTLMGTPDRGVTELLGEGRDQKYRTDGSLWSRKYDGIAYGKDITFVVTYDEYSDVAMVDIHFDDSVSEEQLAAAICDLTGRKPSKNVWYAENAEVLLEKTQDGLCVTLMPFTAEADSEDMVQY